MSTLILMTFNQNVVKKTFDEFFEFVDPYMQQKKFQVINNNPKIYVSQTEMPANIVREIIRKMKNQNNYTQVINSVYTGRLNKL